MWKKRTGRHVRGMKFGMTGGKRDSMTGIFPGQRLIRGRNCREMKIEISVRSLLLVCPILGLPMKFNMTKGCSTNPRAWTVVLQVEKMKFTMFMIKPGEVVKIWPRIFIGPVKIWIRTCMVMI
uniref:SNW domain containing 1 n=1 Tax=Myotis myotis TaxID=51298 RepID=A0A7J8ARW0_MYOMY|nr:SNW domain containing 1 [Myotis myotis]